MPSSGAAKKFSFEKCKKDELCPDTTNDDQKRSPEVQSLGKTETNSILTISTENSTKFKKNATEVNANFEFIEKQKKVVAGSAGEGAILIVLGKP